MAELHFIRPFWLLALLPCIVLLLWFYLRQRYKGRWADYVKPQLWRHVLTNTATPKRATQLTLLALSALLAVLALAGPSWQRLPQPVFRNQSALVVALDLSSSMDSQDLKPSRLQRARHKLLDILERRREGQTALIVYAGAAFAVTPLTDDVNTIRAQAMNLETRLMPAQGGHAHLALDKAMELFAQGGVQRGHMLLITDEVDAALFEAARDRLINAGHSLSILGIGTTEGAPIPVAGGGFLKDSNGAIVLPRLNETELRRLAPYRRISVDDSDIDYLLPDSNPQLFADDNGQTGLQTDTWRDEGPWLLLPLLLISTLAFRRGLLLWACLPLYLITLPWTTPAHAFGWQDLWLNDNQKAKRAFDEQQYENAKELFDDPEWRAASAYRNGDYNQAVEALSQANTADALYNRGNAQAQLGQVEQALESYKQALKLDPRHEDARHNHDLLLQQQQQQQQQNGQSQQNNPSGEQQDSQNQGSQQPQQNQQGGEQQQQESSGQDPQQQAGSDPEQQAETESAEEKEQQQKQQDQAERQGEEQTEKEEGQNSAQASADESDPERENREQWLRLVPDDPGGLLKRKFLYQYRRQQQEQQQPSEEDQEQKQW